MEELSARTEVFRVEPLGSAEMRRRIRAALSAVPGIEHLSVELDEVRATYRPELVSSGMIRKEIERSGGSIRREPEERRGPLRRLLDRLAASNAQTFGSARPDCCSLNRNGHSE